jgi:hypothetical protein
MVHSDPIILLRKGPKLGRVHRLLGRQNMDQMYLESKRIMLIHSDPIILPFNKQGSRRSMSFGVPSVILPPNYIKGEVRMILSQVEQPVD